MAALVAGGEVAAAYAYSPWGEASGAGELPFFGWNSQEHVGGGTALQYLRARFYDAAQAAFPTADTYLGDVSDPATLNRYAYCAGNPVTYSDPTGHERFSSQKQRNSWLKNNSAKGKTQKLNTKLVLEHRKSPLSTGMNNLALSMSKLPLWSGVAARAAKVASGAPKASQAYRTQLPGRASPVFSTPKSGSQKKASSSPSSKSLWGGARSGSLFPHVVSYSQSQAQKIRERFCGKDMKHIGAQAPEPVKIALNVTHTALDLFGFVPVAGAVPDSLNALIYFAEGNDFEGFLSLGAAIPFAGDAGKAGYMAAKYGDDVVDAVKKGAGAVADAAKAADRVAGSASRSAEEIERALSAANRVEDFDPLEKANSAKLGDNLEAINDVRPSYDHDAHHIVPGGHPKAESARLLLSKYRISINSAANGVFLPRQKGVTDAAYHPYLNRTNYINMVNYRLSKAEERGMASGREREEILLELADIKKMLQSPGNSWIWEKK